MPLLIWFPLLKSRTEASSLVETFIRPTIPSRLTPMILPHDLLATKTTLPWGDISTTSAMHKKKKKKKRQSEADARSVVMLHVEQAVVENGDNLPNIVHRVK